MCWKWGWRVPLHSWIPAFWAMSRRKRLGILKVQYFYFCVTCNIVMWDFLIKGRIFWLPPYLSLLPWSGQWEYQREVVGSAPSFLLCFDGDQIGHMQPPGFCAITFTMEKPTGEVIVLTLTEKVSYVILGRRISKPIFVSYQKHILPISFCPP